MRHSQAEKQQQILFSELGSWYSCVRLAAEPVVTINCYHEYSCICSKHRIISHQFA